jgi:hypothetical protein
MTDTEFYADLLKALGSIASTIIRAIIELVKTIVALCCAVFRAHGSDRR